MSAAAQGGSAGTVARHLDRKERGAGAAARSVVVGTPRRSVGGGSGCSASSSGARTSMIGTGARRDPRRSLRPYCNPALTLTRVFYHPFIQVGGAADQMIIYRETPALPRLKNANAPFNAPKAAHRASAYTRSWMLLALTAQHPRAPFALRGQPRARASQWRSLQAALLM